ncbi:hypothetical protein MSAN_02042500 [Mycena sanguinolenta]|uniref:F-box domain-containing protein n=1 Tax=Mycena sanguinolenta TaxID=230812 RepID=A0A8H6XK36_9AGAR|nr:hypothetical protein MSAN_02042500 [Mycena sanguinolenta]
MTTPDEPQPLLPPELEKEIFEVSVLSNLRLIPKFVLVAKRVRAWLEPMLYKYLSVSHSHPADWKDQPSRLVHMSSEQCRRILKSKPPSFFQNHVHHLAFTNLLDEETVRRVLSCCTGIRSLAIFQMDPNSIFLPLIQAAPLVRLSVRFDQLCDPRSHFEPTAFPHLTHLDLSTSTNTSCWTRDLVSLPSLTHLLVYWSKTTTLPFRTVLADCKTLEVLICRIDHFTQVPYYDYFAGDIRAVTMFSAKFLPNWEREMIGGEDYWFVADEFVRRRRSREIPASRYLIPRYWSPSGADVVLSKYF